MFDWSVLAWLSVLLLAMLAVKHWLNQHLQGISLLYSGDEQTAVLIYYLILLPGIFLHELSHLLAATLVGVETRGFSLQPGVRRGRTIRMASVTVQASDPIRESWIGLAPLITGSAMILVLANWRLGLDLAGASSLAAVGQIFASSLRAPDVWLWAYLVFAISNAMLPSESDRRPWLPVLAYLLITGAAMYVAGALAYIPRSVTNGLLEAARYLVLAFSITLLIDLVFGGVILGLEKAGERVLRRRVEY